LFVLLMVFILLILIDWLIDWLIVRYTLKYAYIAGTVTKIVGWLTEESGFDSQLGQRTSLQRVHSFCGTHPFFYSTGIRARQGCVADHLPPSTAEGKN